MDYTKLDWQKIFDNSAYGYDDCRAILDAARIANSYDGSCAWANVFPMDEFNIIVSVDDPLQFAYNLKNGDFDPSNDYFSIDELGWFHSYDEGDLLDIASDNVADVIRAAHGNYEVAESLVNSGRFDIPDNDEDIED